MCHTKFLGILIGLWLRNTVLSFGVLPKEFKVNYLISFLVSLDFYILRQNKMWGGLHNKVQREGKAIPLQAWTGL